MGLQKNAIMKLKEMLLVIKSMTVVINSSETLNFMPHLAIDHARYF